MRILKNIERKMDCSQTTIAIPLQNYSIIDLDEELALSLYNEEMKRDPTAYKKELKKYNGNHSVEINTPNTRNTETTRSTETSWFSRMLQNVTYKRQRGLFMRTATTPLLSGMVVENLQQSDC